MFYRLKKIRVLFWVMLLTLVTISLASALAAANIIPVTHLTDQTRAITFLDLVPPECASIRYALQTLVDCSAQTGGCSGSGSLNELILGTPADDTIDGKSGDDCIVGGGGNDTMFGGNGNDVLVGGPGNDDLNGEGRPIDTDICVDADGSTAYTDCEIIQ